MRKISDPSELRSDESVMYDTDIFGNKEYITISDEDLRPEKEEKLKRNQRKQKRKLLQNYL